MRSPGVAARHVAGTKEGRSAGTFACAGSAGIQMTNPSSGDARDALWAGLETSNPDTTPLETMCVFWDDPVGDELRLYGRPRLRRSTYLWATPFDTMYVFWDYPI